MCLQEFSQFADFLKSDTGHLLTCACRNFPQVCRFSQISHWTFTDMHLQKFLPGLQIFLNQPLTADLLISTCRIPPFSRFSQISHWTFTDMCLQEFPKIADFLKSATGQLLTCACRNSPQVCRFSQIRQWTFTDMCLQKFAPFCRFFQISQWTFTDMCLQKSPPGLQIFSNQPLDIYWDAFTEIPPQVCRLFLNQPLTADLLISTCRIPPFSRFSQISHWTFTDMCLQEFPKIADFLKSATGHLLTCPYRNSPEVCRFSQISQWTFTDMCLQKFPPGLQIFLNQPLDIY